MTTPKAAKGVLLGLPPLHVIIKTEDQTATYIITCSHQWKHKSTMAKLNRLETWNMNTSYLRNVK
jgi:hypothetical protein